MTKKIRIESVGARLQAVREAQGMPKRQLAIALELSPATISEIENDNIGLGVERMIDVCNLFGITPDEFLGISSDSEKITYVPLQRLVPKLNKLKVKDVDVITEVVKKFV